MAELSATVRAMAANTKPGRRRRLRNPSSTGILRNHPFLDGNKRTGLVVAALFLESNRLRLRAPEEEAVIMTRGLTAGEIEEAAYARWLADNV